MKVAIVTDTNSGISRQEERKLGVHVVPMPFMINGDVYYEGINLSQEDFYRLLSENADVSTSQPAVADVLEYWDRLLKEYDEIVYIPMSSGLSGACGTAMSLSLDYDERVQVVDNRRVSATLYSAVLDALKLVDEGMNAKEIKARLEESSADSSIYIMVDTMKYLKKGGRVTAAAATVGAVLNIKPVLQIQGGKLDAFAKPRGIKAACGVMCEAVKTDLEGRFADFADRMRLYIAYTHDRETAEMFAQEVQAVFPNYELVTVPLPLSVACHIGPCSLAIACAVAL